MRPTHAHANSHMVTVRTTVAFCCRGKRAISRPGHVAASHAFHYDGHPGNLVEGDHGPLPDLKWYWYDTISDIPQKTGRYWWRTRKAYNNSGDESVSCSRAKRAGGAKQVYQLCVSALMRSSCTYYVLIFSCRDGARVHTSLQVHVCCGEPNTDARGGWGWGEGSSAAGPRPTIFTSLDVHSFRHGVRSQLSTNHMFCFPSCISYVTYFDSALVKECVRTILSCSVSSR